MGVARTGRLIALKVLSRDDIKRPQDIADLRALLAMPRLPNSGEQAERAPLAREQPPQDTWNREHDVRLDGFGRSPVTEIAPRSSPAFFLHCPCLFASTRGTFSHSGADELMAC